MSEKIKLASKKLDDMINFNKVFGGVAGAIVEAVDGGVFKLCLEKGREALPDNLKDEFDLILEAFISGDWSMIEEGAVERINAAINIPVLDEEDEGELIGAIIGAILKIAKKKAAQAKKDIGGGGPGPDGPG